jgi:hypothetical protein
MQITSENPFKKKDFIQLISTQESIIVDKTYQSSVTKLLTKRHKINENISIIEEEGFGRLFKKYQKKKPNIYKLET